MAKTLVTSDRKEVVISPDSPFCIIGERLNPTNRPIFMAELAAGDYWRVEQDTIRQVEAGAHILDVNCGVPLADEPKILSEVIQLVQSLTDLPLCIDSSIIAALESGVEVYKGRPLINSVTGEEESLERVLPLVKKHDCSVVAISNDETGISEDPNVRFEVAKKIVERAQDHGIKRNDVVVDPLVMPLGAMGTAGRQVFALCRRLHEELDVNITCGASNVSFGLPNRHAMNATFLAMASTNGMTSAIMNPLHQEELTGIKAADALNANDENCKAWIKAFRVPTPEGEGARGARREGGRRRRAN